VVFVKTDVFEGTYRHHHQTRIGELGTMLAVTSSPILVTLMIEAIRSAETSVLTRITRRDIPEDDILHSHHRGNIKSYVTYWFLQRGPNVFPVKLELLSYICYFML
jgi:hypothetical protein